jgi:hypothetical protein
MSEDESPMETDAKKRREEAATAIREQFANVEDELAKTRAELDEAKREVHLLKHTDDGRLFVAETMLAEAKAALRDADAWIERVGQATEAVIIVADNKTPGLALLADLALWNDRRKALLADANPATTDEPAQS